MPITTYPYHLKIQTFRCSLNAIFPVFPSAGFAFKAASSLLNQTVDALPQITPQPPPQYTS